MMINELYNFNFNFHADSLRAGKDLRKFVEAKREPLLC